MSRITNKIFIAVGVVLFLAGALSLLAHSRIWAAYDMLLGISFILSGTSFTLGGTSQKVTRGLSFGFLGAALVFLGIGLAPLVP